MLNWHSQNLQTSYIGLLPRGTHTYMYVHHVCTSCMYMYTVPPTKHYSFQCIIYNLQYFYEIFGIFKSK